MSWLPLFFSQSLSQKLQLVLSKGKLKVSYLDRVVKPQGLQHFLDLAVSISPIKRGKKFQPLPLAVAPCPVGDQNPLKEQEGESTCVKIDTLTRNAASFIPETGVEASICLPEKNFGSLDQDLTHEGMGGNWQGRLLHIPCRSRASLRHAEM